MKSFDGKTLPVYHVRMLDIPCKECRRKVVPNETQLLSDIKQMEYSNNVALHSHL
jgi:hypothetical protein